MSLLSPKHIKGNAFQIGIYSACVVFLTYTMVFGFRKSFTVATFDGLQIAGYSYKTLLVLSQMLGYMLAKFYGIKYISELQRHGRGAVIILLTGISWISWYFLLLFRLHITSFSFLSMVFHWECCGEWSFLMLKDAEVLILLVQPLP